MPPCDDNVGEVTMTGVSSLNDGMLFEVPFLRLPMRGLSTCLVDFIVVIHVQLLLIELLDKFEFIGVLRQRLQCVFVEFLNMHFHPARVA